MEFIFADCILRDVENSPQINNFRYASGQFFGCNRIAVMDLIKSYPAICMHVDGCSDVNSKSLFNVMARGPLSFVFKKFSLQGKKESAVNMDDEVSTVMK